MAKKKGLSSLMMAFVGLVVGIVAGFGGLTYFKLPETDSVEVLEEIYYSNGGNDSSIDISNAEISIHFLELGNKYTGDCTYIKTDTCDILIDCGSKSSSISTISNYLNKYVTDGVLEYVIVTHAHQDHYAGFATSSKTNGIFDLYKCETIIDFAGTTTGKQDTATYKNYETKLTKSINQNNSKHWTALDCVKGTNGASQEFSIGTNSTLKILDTGFYEPENVDKTNENNNSVCCLISNGSKNFLFTGDLEKEGEANLVAKNSLPEVDLYKAGHHGSKTSSSAKLIDKVKPKTVCVCCCAGSSEYSDNVESQFPTQLFIDNVGKWTDEIYVTTMCVDYKNNKFQSFNGNIVYMATNSGYNVNCSDNNTKLKDSEWFEKNRVWNGV